MATRIVPTAWQHIVSAPLVMRSSPLETPRGAPGGSERRALFEWGSRPTGCPASASGAPGQPPPMSPISPPLDPQAWQTHVEERIAKGLPEGTPGALRATKSAAAKKAGGAASPRAAARAAAAGLGASNPAQAQARPQSARPASARPASAAAPPPSQAAAAAAARPATARPATARPASAAGAGAAARRGGLPAKAGRLLCSGELRGSGLCVKEFELGPDELPPVRLRVEP